MPRSPPQVTLLQNKENELPLRVSNPYGKDFSGELMLSMPKGWADVKATPFTLRAGESKVLPIKLSPPTGEATNVQITASIRPADTVCPAPGCQSPWRW